MMFRLLASVLLSVGLAGSSANWTPDLRRANILVIGDSQIMFRGGDAYVAFFEKFANLCRATVPEHATLFDTLSNVRVGVLGVRSTAIPSWVARDAAGKAKVCVPEKSWPVNAKGFGALHDPTQKWFQIGKVPNYPLCQTGQSPLEALFKTAGIDPKLLVLTFLGRTADRWAKSPKAAQTDAAALAAQVPAKTACISMTTAPTFRSKINEMRVRAQNNFNPALAALSGSCRPVDGLTPDTLAQLEKNAQFYKTNAVGKVRDPFHPKGEGVRVVLESIAPSLCRQAAVSLKHARDAGRSKP